MRVLLLLAMLLAATGVASADACVTSICVPSPSLEEELVAEEGGVGGVEYGVHASALENSAFLNATTSAGEIQAESWRALVFAGGDLHVASDGTEVWLWTFPLAWSYVAYDAAGRDGSLYYDDGMVRGCTPVYCAYLPAFVHPYGTIIGLL